MTPLEPTQHDSEAAGIASAQSPEARENEAEHALDLADKGMGEEGTNLIGEEPAP